MINLYLLKKLVSIPSVFPNEGEIADFISAYLKKLKFKVTQVKSGVNRYNIVAKLGESNRYLAFYGHIDTVSANGWKNPFVLSVKQNIARGLGVADMKGGITAILILAEYASKNNLPVKIIFAVDEENISQGAHDLVDSGLLDDISFLISAENGQVQDITQSLSLIYGRKGRVLFELRVFGKKAHAAEAEIGLNPIEQAGVLIQEITNINFPIHPRLGEAKIAIHSISSGVDSFSIPDLVTIKLSLLTTPYTSTEQFVEIIHGLARKFGIRVSIGIVKRKTPFGESYEVNRSNSCLSLLEKKIFNPNKIKPFYTPSIADENVFANRLGIPVISIGPIGGGDHSKDEWLDLKSLDFVERIYKEILHLYANKF